VFLWLLGGVPAGRWVKGKGERKGKNKIKTPTQIISPPLIKGGGI